MNSYMRGKLGGGGAGFDDFEVERISARVGLKGESECRSCGEGASCLLADRREAGVAGR